MKPLVRETLKDTGRIFGIILISVTLCNVFDGFEFSRLLGDVPIVAGLCLVYAAIYYFAHR